jgi:hypothetical protein
MGSMKPTIKLAVLAALVVAVGVAIIILGPGGPWQPSPPPGRGIWYPM